MSRLESARAAVTAGEWREGRRLAEELAAAADTRYEGLDLLAAVALGAGRPREALAVAEQAVRHSPTEARGFLRLGAAHLGLGATVRAVDAFEHAVDLDPGSAVAHQALGLARLDLGAGQEAVAALGRSLELFGTGDRRAAVSHWSLATHERPAGRWVEARRNLERALHLDPNLAPARRDLSRLVADRRALSEPLDGEARERLARALSSTLADPAVDPQDVMSAAATLARHEPRVEQLWRTLGEPEADLGNGDWGPVEGLLLGVLERAIVTDLVVERRLLDVRRCLLGSEPASLTATAPRVEVVCALAAQAFNGQYLHPLEPEETAGAERWRRWLERVLDGRPTAPATFLALAVNALAGPLEERLGGELALAHLEPYPPPVTRLLARHLREPAADALAAADFRAQKSEAPSSAPVRRHYERHPYPRWNGLRLDSSPRPVATVLRSLFPHFEPPGFLTHPCRLLVAGCGTGQQVVAAWHRFRLASLLAIDLSAESLAYAVRMAERYKLGEVATGRCLDWRQADLLKLSPQEGPFDVVLATGVLHHLADPEAGWSQLCQMVRPGGVIKVGLYSRLARRPLDTARQEVAHLASAGSDDDAVREARQVLAHGPHAEHLSRFVDFFTAAGCHDLLFHVRERTYDLSQVADVLERLGLRFLGFELPRQEVGELYSTLFPLDARRVDLGGWAAVESAWPESFVDMYQMWCQVPP